jgi:hypothetical protein
MTYLFAISIFPYAPVHTAIYCVVCTWFSCSIIRTGAASAGRAGSLSGAVVRDTGAPRLDANMALLAQRAVHNSPHRVGMRLVHCCAFRLNHLFSSMEPSAPALMLPAIALGRRRAQRDGAARGLPAGLDCVQREGLPATPEAMLDDVQQSATSQVHSPRKSPDCGANGWPTIHRIVLSA